MFQKTNISHPLIRTRAYKGLALKGSYDLNNISPEFALLPEDVFVKKLLYGNTIFDESDNHKILETSIRYILF